MSSNAPQAPSIEELIQQHYPDAHRISVELSATGAGHHLRWHYTEDQLPNQEGASQGRAPSAPLSRTSTALVDEDGDSVMGDEERPQTPQALAGYDPGSVVLTPKKDGWRPRREQRIGGGFNWWHEEEGVVQRLGYMRDVSNPPELIDRSQLGPDALHFLEAVEAERARHGARARAQGSAPPAIDDDAVSTASLRSEATVIIDPRGPPKETLFNGELPIVRLPSDPDEYHRDTGGPSAGPSTSKRGPLCTIQEESEEAVGKQKASKVGGFMHMFHAADGQWVRIGSPPVEFGIKRSLLPPRVDDMRHSPSAEAGPSSRRHAHPLSQAGHSRTSVPPANRLQRTDTLLDLRGSPHDRHSPEPQPEPEPEPRLQDKTRSPAAKSAPSRAIPYVLIPPMPAKYAALRPSTPAAPVVPLRRSARLQMKVKGV